MDARFAFEVLDHWKDVRKIRPTWDALYREWGGEHPFVRFDWLEGWYEAFCAPTGIRVVLVRDEERVRAIFPAFRTDVVRKGFRLRTVSSASNGHSPRFGILCAAGDLQSVRAALLHPFSDAWGEKIDLVSLINVAETSQTSAGSRLQTREVSRHIENSFDSPALSLRGGWRAYYDARSRNFRHRFRQSRNNLARLGPFGFDFVPLPGEAETVHRLKRIDARTWQHANGTGLFSTLENEAFYTFFLTSFSKRTDAYVGFVTTQGRDIAYELGFSDGSTSYLLKYGFDREYSRFRPGVLVQHYLCEHLANRGIEEVDLCGEATEEKVKWATHFRSHHNVWLLNQQSLVGKCASWGVSLLQYHRSASSDGRPSGNPLIPPSTTPG